jgi:hypothetical protein
MSAILFLATRLKLPPWLIEAILVIALILGFALYERHQGAASCRRADAALVKEQEAHNRDLKAQGTTTVFLEGQTYHDAIAAPVSRPLVVRLCKPSGSGGVPQASTAANSTDGGTPLRGDPPPTVGPDIGDGLIRNDRQADAQVNGLRDYILNVCSKR